MDLLGERLMRIQDRIHRTCARVGRNPASVRLIAATKAVPVEILRRLPELACVDFGENRVQEALPKIDALAGLPVHWHFIGRLQRNKVKYILGRFERVHSVDSIPLAEDLDRRVASTNNRILRCLIEVNLSEETQKGGVCPRGIDALLDTARRLHHLSFEGVMTMTPFGADEARLRKIFSDARELADRHGLAHLSMGMSDDFEIAIEEGATLLRIGRGIFGERPLGKGAVPVPRGTV